MNESVRPRLFLVDELCSSCPMYIFDEKTNSWRRSRSNEKPVVGDRVVLEMLTEMVVTSTASSNITYRKLRSKETPLWNGSYPDKMPVGVARVFPDFEIDHDDFVDPLLLEIGKDRLKVSKLS